MMHVTLGPGPVGCWIALSLRLAALYVRAVNSSGARAALLPAGVLVGAANLSRSDQAIEAVQGASVPYRAL